MQAPIPQSTPVTFITDDRRFQMVKSLITCSL
ncbi:hypothetical protein CS829B_6250 [Chlamydia suis]|nr:hypothetical protein CS829B_6250 [Chlamydia suis]